MNNVKTFWMAVLAVYAALIFYGSSVPGSAQPAGPAYSDKTVHFAEFFVFGFLVFKATAPSNRRSILFSLLFALSYALLDEVHQSFVPLREASIFDFMADAAGIGVAGFAAVMGRNKSLSPKNQL